MRCPECGTLGYSRNTMTPKWRCRKCGREWDDSFESQYTGLSTQQRLENLGGLIAVGLFIAAIVGVLISAISASTG